MIKDISHQKTKLKNDDLLYFELRFKNLELTVYHNDFGITTNGCYYDHCFNTELIVALLHSNNLVVIRMLVTCTCDC